jgi:hypothetical protein
MKNIKTYAQVYQHQLYHFFCTDGEISYVTLSEESRSVGRRYFRHKQLC